MFNLETMRRYCLADIADFRTFGDVSETRDGISIFIDRGASVLAVAHLDTVCKADRFAYDEKKERVYTPTLDDRLGVSIILDALPRVLGHTDFDVLLTEGEEIGRSTAKYFDAPRDYNWLFSFDRTGTDAVHYQYTDAAWMQALKGLDMRIEPGMFSDLSFMSHVGACGVNVGCAYYRYHSPRAYANLRETASQVAKFARFYEEHKATRYEHTPDARDFGAFANDDWLDDIAACETCGLVTYVTEAQTGALYCDDCYPFGAFGDACDGCLELAPVRTIGKYLLCDTCIDSIVQTDEQRRDANV